MIKVTYLLLNTSDSLKFLKLLLPQHLVLSFYGLLVPSLLFLKVAIVFFNQVATLFINKLLLPSIKSFLIYNLLERDLFFFQIDLMLDVVTDPVFLDSARCTETTD